MMSVAQLLDRMGSGYRLRISHDGADVRLVDAYGLPNGRAPILLDKPEVDAAIASGLITKLTEHGEGSRIGWRSAGYDGDVADWWVCTQ